MRIFYFLFLFSSLSFAQRNPLELKIESITFTDSIPNIRKFTVNYHIKNTIDGEVSFINVGYPLTSEYPDTNELRVYMSLLDKDTYLRYSILESSLEFLQFRYNYKNAISAADKKKFSDAYRKSIGRDSIGYLKERERIVKINDFDYVRNAIYTFKPHEIKKSTTTYYWNKERYIIENDLEYYIDENTSYYFELSLPLFKEQFQYFFSEEEYKKMKDNPNFIDGIIRSNQVEINFKE